MTACTAEVLAAPLFLLAVLLPLVILLIWGER